MPPTADNLGHVLSTRESGKSLGKWREMPFYAGAALNWQAFCFKGRNLFLGRLVDAAHAAFS